MLGYIFILLICFFLGFDAHKINPSKQKRKLFLIVVFGAMICFAVLRSYSVGIDYINRVNQMRLLFNMNFSEMIAYTDQVQKGEYLYTLYIWIVSRVLPIPWLINGIMDIFILCTFGWFIGRYSSDVNLSSLMFVTFAFAASLNVTRQYVAASFFLIALHFLIQKKPLKALFPLLLAAFIHSSAVILFVIYAIYAIGFNLTRKKLLCFLLGAIASFFAFDIILDIFVQIFPQYKYALSGWTVGDESFSFLWLFIYLFLFCLIYSRLPHRITQDVQYLQSNSISMIVIGFMFYAVLDLLKSELDFVHRVQVYFIFGFCMILSEILHGFGLGKKRNSAMVILFKIGVMAWAIFVFSQDGHGILPYNFIWNWGR